MLHARVLGVLGLLAAGFLVSGAAPAQDEPSFDDVISAIVAVHATIPPTARTAAVLGTEREGSGVVISDDGLILTIGYLILEASQVQITSADGQTQPAAIVAYDHDSGFGLLRASHPLAVRPMPLGDSMQLRSGDRVLVAGFGGVDVVRPAIVAARGPFAAYWEYLLEHAIFTAPPYPLYGGAALIGPNGELLGIGELLLPDVGHGERDLPGNLFVPIDVLKPILADLVARGRTVGQPRPWLGLYLHEVGGRLVVIGVAQGGPAARAGVAAGDVIVALGDRASHSLADFYRALWSRGAAGIAVPLTVLKGRRIVKLTVKSGDHHQWLHWRPRRPPGRP